MVAEERRIAAPLDSGEILGANLSPGPRGSYCGTMGSHRLTPRERLLRIGGGVLVIVAGVIAFQVSKAHDPENKAAVLAILAVIFGATWVGQGIRGIREGLTHHEDEAAPPPVISAEKSVAGILLAWIVPGLGHVLVGKRAKGVLFFVTITATFVAGVLLAEGRNLDYDRDRVYFLAYMFNAGETALGWLATHGLERTHEIRFLQLGFLYSAVACLLNVVVMMDFISLCARSARHHAAGSPEAGAHPGGEAPPE